MKSLLVLLVIGNMRFARSDTDLSEDELKMLCSAPENPQRSSDMRVSSAFIKSDMNILEFTYPERNVSVDAFLTDSRRFPERKSFYLHTFSQPRKRFGVDKNGKLEIDHERTTTFHFFHACQSFLSFVALCASRKGYHFLVSVSDLGAEGYRVSDCSKPINDSFCNTTDWTKYLVRQVYYQNSRHLSLSKCYEFQRKNQSCSEKSKSESPTPSAEPSEQDQSVTQRPPVHPSSVTTILPMQPATEKPSVRPERSSVAGFDIRVEGSCRRVRRSSDLLKANNLVVFRCVQNSTWEVEEPTSNESVPVCHRDQTVDSIRNSSFCQKNRTSSNILFTHSSIPRKFRCSKGEEPICRVLINQETFK